MARIEGVAVPHYPHHVTQRVNRRQRTCFCEADYQLYLGLDAWFCDDTGTETWAYCLMPNHVHLVMVPATEDGLTSSSNVVRRQTNFDQ